MENSNQQPSRANSRGWLVLLLSVVVAAIAAYFPFALLLAPALWAYAGARTKPAWMILPIAVFALCTLQISSFGILAGWYGASALCAVLLYVMMTRRMSNSDTALILAGVFLVGLYATLCLPGILAGRGAFADVQDAMNAIIAMDRETIAQMPQIDANMAKSIMDTMNLIYESIPVGLVAVLCILASVLGLGNLLFFRLFCRKHPEIAISPIRPFRDWTLPNSTTLGLFAILVLSLIAELADWTIADAFAMTANILVALPLFLQGLCVIDYFIVRSGKNITTTRVLIYIGTVVLFQYTAMALLLIGCFDQIFRIRLRMSTLPPSDV